MAGLGGARGGPHGTNPGTLITRGKPGVASTFELWGDTSGGQDEPLEAPPAEKAVAGDGTSEKTGLGVERYREP